ncbi:hypothetical protein [Citrobacter koseri]|uniref:hypothetical protein n=1 Tax=Citrobacter koseri TaxID=545 RepID=UPI00185FE92A|nr:hypothetical protein [Citrobacter koseri]BCL48894.1 hypothetical protein MPUCK001_27120 [Citrobacter koseri]
MKTIQLSERELSIVYSLMAPPYRAEDILSDEFNELRNKVFYALRDAQNDEPVSNRDELPDIVGWIRSDYHSDRRMGDAPIFILGCIDPSDVWGVKYIPLSGNSPVIPNGWVMVPVEPTEAMINAYRGALYSGESAVSCIDLYKAMIAAAPQQEE